MSHWAGRRSATIATIIPEARAGASHLVLEVPATASGAAPNTPLLISQPDSAAQQP
jgi:hypothetical protein